MGVAVQFDNADQVVETYRENGRYAFALGAGPNMILNYDGSEVPEGEDKLQYGATKLENYLQMLQSGNSAAIYWLRIYPDGQRQITTKTPHSGGCNFQLVNRQITRVDPVTGNVYIVQDSERKMQPATPSLPINNQQLIAAQSEAAQLRAQLDHERELRHKSEINTMIAGFEAKISGLSLQQPAEKDPITRLVDLFEQIIIKPEIGMTWIDMIRGKSGVNYEQYMRPAGAVSGTTAVAEAQHETTATTAEPTNTFIENFIPDEVKNLSKGKQMEHVIQQLVALEQKPERGIANTDGYEQCGADMLVDIQDECIKSIEQRIGAPMITAMLLKVESLNEDDMRRLISNLF
jgi:hypothetical protein